MSRRDTYEEKTRLLLEPLLEQNNFELYDVEYVREGSTWYLRAYIDKPGGITINDCEIVSRALSDLLDQKDFIEDAYILEVSSPGLGRPLKRDRDFEKSIGQKVDLKLFAPLDEIPSALQGSAYSEKEFSGILESYDKENVRIRTEDGEVLCVPRKNLAVIRLAFDF